MVLNRHLHSFIHQARLARSLRVTRHIPYLPKRFNNQTQPPNPGQVNPDPMDQDDPDEDGKKGKGQDDGPTFKSTILRMLETAATTFASIAILGYVAAKETALSSMLACLLTATALLGTRTINTTSI